VVFHCLPLPQDNLPEFNHWQSLTLASVAFVSASPWLPQNGVQIPNFVVFRRNFDQKPLKSLLQSFIV